MPESAEEFYARIAAATDDDGRLASGETGIPVTLFLEPRRHGDLADMSEERAAEMGRLLVVVAAAVEALPSVGRAHVCRWGDGSAHLHWWVMGRPARIPQLLGSFLPLWEEYLPRIPADVRNENVRFVVDRVVDAYGGVPGARCPMRRRMTARLRASRR